MTLTLEALRTIPDGGPSPEFVVQRRAWEERRARWDAIRREERIAATHRRLAAEHAAKAERLLEEAEA